MTREARPPSDPGWLQDQVAKSVASLDSLLPRIRAALAQPTTRRRRPVRASEFPADPPPRPPVMAEGATWPSGAVAPFPAALFNAVAVAIVGAIPPDDACLADENECFERHPVHLGWSVDGTARTVYAKVDGLVEIVLAAVVPLIRAQVAAELVAEARELQAAIDHPDSDADTMSSLIDEAEGLWSAIHVVDEATWRRECEQPPYVRPEPDEPVADVRAAFEAGEKGVTKRPTTEGQERSEEQRHG